MNVVDAWEYGSIKTGFDDFDTGYLSNCRHGKIVVEFRSEKGTLIVI